MYEGAVPTCRAYRGDFYELRKQGHNLIQEGHTERSRLVASQGQDKKADDKWAYSLSHANGRSRAAVLGEPFGGGVGNAGPLDVCQGLHSGPKFASD